MKTIRLLTCDNLAEAYSVKDKLTNEGIACFLTNENFTNLMPMYNNMLGSGIQVFIDEADLEIARALVKDKLEPDNTELICPFCGSDQVGLGLGKSRAIKILNMVMAFTSAIPLGNLKPKYYCKKCRNEIR